MDRIERGAYEDTNRLFTPPDHFDLRVLCDGSPEYWAEQEGLKRVGQACIAVRNTQGLNEHNLFGFEYVRTRIEHALREFEGLFTVVPLPNITHVFYGRDVGYAVERIDLDQAMESISATEIRRRLAQRSG
jgi:hypothetical protein